jgi:hypothetical protein
MNDSTPLQLLLLGLLLTACHAGVVGRGVPSSYGHDVSSASAACRQNPLYCAKVAGEEAIVPGAGSLQPLATAGGTVAVAVKVLDGALQLSIREALEQCADQARTNVLLKHMNGRRPTPQECNEQVERDGRTLSRAMWLGNLMHDDAFECIKEKLDLLRLGGFSLKQRYRYNERTGETTLVSKEEVERLIKQGRKNELLGTIEPDVVLHEGDPLQAEDVYDFKFPCVDIDQARGWRRYPQGHPYQGRTQKEMYVTILKTSVSQVIPWMGIHP